MSRATDVEIAKRVCGLYEDLIIMDTSFSSGVTKAAKSKMISTTGGKQMSVYDLAVNKGKLGMGMEAQIQVIGRDQEITAKGVATVAKRVNTTRAAVCDQCAQLVIHYCVENGFEGKLEWITIPYTGTSGHSIVVAHRSGTVNGGESGWGSYFVIDLWYSQLGMRTRAVHETSTERKSYYKGDIKKQEKKLTVRYTVAGTGTVVQTTAKKGRCYLSTAACEVMGLPDDCPELMILRKFRDTVLSQIPEGRRDIDTYYAGAESVLEVIDSRPDRLEILRGIYRESVRPAVDAIVQGRHEDAHNVLRKLLRTWAR